MTPEQWRAIRPILECALELDPERRSQYLDSACTDRAIRAEVESLLLAHDQADSDVLQVVPPLRIDDEEEAQYRVPRGKRIGAYKIVDEIAVGGMGAVYRATRDDGQYRQEVALKIVRTELGGELVSARFKNERQILASLDHPNIAKILDGGATSEGIPYLVMELIDGLPITEYCDRHLLPLTARIELFRTACSAVHYAHQRLVIHRDIKPSNILVTQEGVLKLLDFGIAKILNPQATLDLGGLTVAGTALMTPAYASPEQLQNEPITTATDVYSLGCVLYELLTGYRALQLTSSVPHEIARAVLEQDPDKPSAIVHHATDVEQNAAECAEASRLRAETPRKLQRRLRGDLDNIVMHAIRKEAAARYQSVAELSEDLRRHLSGEPVFARKSTLGYQIGKFVSRHKIAVAAAITVFVTVLAGLLVTLHEARIARDNELRAEQRFNDVRRLANSMMFEIHDSIAQVPGATAARQLLIRRAQEYLENLTWDSNSDSELLRELAAAHTRLATVLGNPSNSNLGDTRAAIDYYRKAIALLEFLSLRKPDDPDTSRDLALNYTRLNMALTQVGDMAGRRLNIEKALAILVPLNARGPENQDVARNLAYAYAEYGFIFRDERDRVRGLEYFRKSQAVYQSLHDKYPEHPVFQQNLAHSYRHIGTLLALDQRFAEALASYRTAAAMNEAMLKLKPDNGETRFNVTLSDSNIAFVLGEMGKVDEALALYRKVLQSRTELLQADPLDERARTGVAETLNYIGVNLERKNQLAAALKSYEESQAVRKILAENNPADDSHAIELAWIDAKIGRIHAKLAFAPGVKREQQFQNCSEARERIERSMPKWIESQKSQVRLGAGTDKELAELKQAVASCESLLGTKN